MKITNAILKLRLSAFFLFLIPAIALIGSLIFHNYLVSFNFTYEENYGFAKNLSGEKIKIECNEQNNFCQDIVFGRKTNLGNCYKFAVDRLTISGAGEILDINDKLFLNVENLVKNSNQKIFIEWKVTDRLNKNCILNTNFAYFYKIAPPIFEKTYSLLKNKKTSLGSSEAINPIFYGEASISNIVKRYPVKLIFKPLMYISVILMIFYWYYNKLILNNLLDRKKNNIFFLFGVSSAIFLLFHVIFLGWNFENEIFRKGRRYFIVFFILFEVLAQAFLIKDIFKNKLKLMYFLNNIVINLKLIFVFLVCLSTLIIIVILSKFDLSDKVDYVLEWNYFLILLLFYLLSSLLWKKQS